MDMEMSIRLRVRIGRMQNKKMEENEKGDGVHCARASVSLGCILIHNCKLKQLVVATQIEMHIG